MHNDFPTPNPIEANICILRRMGAKIFIFDDAELSYLESMKYLYPDWWKNTEEVVDAEFDKSVKSLQAKGLIA